MKPLVRTIAALAGLAFFSIGSMPRERASTLVSPSSMYLAVDGMLYVSDPQSGIHVYTTSASAAPVYRVTIPLPGNSGVAVRDSIIYANSYGSILALRLKAEYNWDTAAVIRNDYYYHPIDEGVHRGWGCTRRVDYAVSGGTGSSYAVFALIDTFLYYVDGYSLITMSVAQPASPRRISTTSLNWDLETLFPTPDYLFVGAASGMYILNRRPNPASPVLISRFSHARACDPVVVQDTIAYITLRAGAACGVASNAFMTVSIADPSSPILLDSIVPEHPPYGLSVRDSLVFIGHGSFGMRLYGVARPDSITIETVWSSPSAIDFIWKDNLLFVMATTGISAFDVSNPRAPVLLGRVN